MKARLLHIFVFAAMIAGVSVSCGRHEAEVIPRSKMARIYAEMLILDQWIASVPGVRMVADTSLVYEPIFEKYGFTSDDYRYSMDVYMNDPERYARILRASGDMIDKRIKELEAALKLEELRAALPKIKADFRPEEFFPYLFDEPYVHYYDSLAIEPDSVLWIYRMRSVETVDTIYDRLRMIILDTLSVKDTLAQKDSIAVADSLVAADSLLAADSLKPADSVRRPSTVKLEEEPIVRRCSKKISQMIIMDKPE
jgi:hypothetical protein